MRVKVRLDITVLKRKVKRLTGEDLPAEIESNMLQLGEACIAQILRVPRAEREARIRRALERQFKSVFVPVVLKHVRPEKWPNLQPIYRARIIQHHKRFQGRKRFYVDEAKEQALFDRLLRRALSRDSEEVYTFRFLPTSDRRWRLEILRTGPRNAGREAVLIGYAKQNFRYFARRAVVNAISRSGLR
jgi:hypothetical protein